MRQVEITNGVYGYRTKSGSITPVEAGGRVLVPDGEAARLVGRGVAAYVDFDDPADPAEAGNPVPAAVGAAEPRPVYDMGMKLEQLKVIAARYGVDTSSMRAKREVCDAIDDRLDAMGAGASGDDDDDGDGDGGDGDDDDGMAAPLDLTPQEPQG